MPSYPGVFQFDTFLSVALSESRCIFAFGASSSPSNSFPVLLIHSAFLLCSLRWHICFKIVSVLCHLIVSMCWSILPLLTDGIFFRCFGMSCYASILISFLDIFLAFLLWPVPSGLFSRVVLFLLLVEKIFFPPYKFRRFTFVLSFFLVDFLSVFPVEFPIQVLSFCLCFLEEHGFYHRLITRLRILVRLILWNFWDMC